MTLWKKLAMNVPSNTKTTMYELGVLPQVNLLPAIFLK